MFLKKSPHYLLLTAGLLFGLGVGTVAQNNIHLQQSWMQRPGVTGTSYGTSVAAVGDVNGDGYQDVLVGAQGAASKGKDTGEVNLYLGSASGLGQKATWTVQGEKAGIYFGRTVAGVGDVNGDGFDDVAIGAPDFGANKGGGVFLYLGSPNGLNQQPAWTKSSDHKGGGFGRAIAGVGDVNGDGFDDVVIGDPLYSKKGKTHLGRAYLYLGNSKGLAGKHAWSTKGSSKLGSTGDVVSSAGDVNADGFDDVLIGVPGFMGDTYTQGKALLFLGNRSGLNERPAWTHVSGISAARFGSSLAGLGDVDGDGYGDVAIGLPGLKNSQDYEGAVMVFRGTSQGLSDRPVWTYESGLKDAYFGYTLAPAGDLNRDGHADLFVGGTGGYERESSGGSVWAFLGSANGMGSSPAWSTSANNAGAYLGVSISSGDIDGDGTKELLAGAYLFDHGAGKEGAAFLYKVGKALLNTNPSWFTDGLSHQCNLGYSMTVCDVNGDGMTDVFAGSPMHQTRDPMVGLVMGFYGSKSGLKKSPDWQVSGSKWVSRGQTLTCGGDVNKDGKQDLLVTDAFFGPGGHKTRVNLYLGSSRGLSNKASWSRRTGVSGDSFGSAMVPAGDVNGDGRDDVLISAASTSHGQKDEGRIYLYSGSPGGLKAPAAWSYESNQAKEEQGWVLSAAGDVNGDGRPDFVSVGGGRGVPGKILLFTSGAKGLNRQPAQSWTVPDGETGVIYGMLLADFNGDGFDDLALGLSRSSQGAENAGLVWIFNGSAEGLATTPGTTKLGSSPKEWFGSALAAADLNGDGYADLAVGANGWGGEDNQRGQVSLFLGSANGVSSSSVWTIQGDQAGGHLGGELEFGDTNGDGALDLIVAATSYDGAHEMGGRIYVYPGLP